MILWLEITIVICICVLIYAAVATMWILRPQTVIRWAKYFAIKIKDPRNNIRPLFESDLEEKQIEVKKLGGEKNNTKRKNLSRGK